MLATKNRFLTVLEAFRWLPQIVTGSLQLLLHRDKAIIVRLMGGLGNQMFQYAAAQKISLETNRPLFVDISFLCNRNRHDNFVYRSYELGLFNIGARVVYASRYAGAIVSDIDSRVNDASAHNITDAVNAHSGPVMLEGYWQSVAFLPDKDYLKTLYRILPTLSVEQNELLTRILVTDSVMVNIRRTDFLVNDFHGVVEADYYDAAMVQIESRIENPTYFFFSDDPDWCQATFGDRGHTIVGHEYAGSNFSTYLYLMIQCKHFIVPNSSFAWWAAYLGESEHSIVCRPNFFLKGASSEIYQNLAWISVRAD